MRDHKKLPPMTERSEERAPEATARTTARKPYVPPMLHRYGDLPIITAGSISEEAWGFEEED